MYIKKFPAKLLFLPFLCQKQSKQRQPRQPNEQWAKKGSNGVHALNIWDCKHAYSIFDSHPREICMSRTTGEMLWTRIKIPKIRKQCTSRKIYILLDPPHARLLTYSFSAQRYIFEYDRSSEKAKLFHFHSFSHPPVGTNFTCLRFSQR